MLSGPGGLNRDHELVDTYNKMQELKIQRLRDNIHNKELMYPMNNPEAIHKDYNLYWEVF